LLSSLGPIDRHAKTELNILRFPVQKYADIENASSKETLGIKIWLGLSGFLGAIPPTEVYTDKTT